jgi:hypothetical protein
MQVGESCVPDNPLFGEQCADGLSCKATLGIITDNLFTCFPSETDELYPDNVCFSLYSADLHDVATNLGTTMSYGAGSGAAAGVQVTAELGTVYDPDGCFGCYLTDCVGGTSDVEAGYSVCVGFYESMDAFQGPADVFVEEAGLGINFATMQITDVTNAELKGTADCLSLEANIAPFSVSYLECSTIVDTVGCRIDGELVPVTNNPPVALCNSPTACADPAACVVGASIDDGSFDPDGDPISVSQGPEGPYDIGEHLVMLTVSDQDGESSSCSGQVIVEDCSPPTITCPPDAFAECQGARRSVVDPGDATATDCSGVFITDPGPGSYPLGDTIVTYTAIDTWDNATSCNSVVSIADTTAPEISCNARNFSPPEAPISFGPTANDGCDEADIEITGVDCFKYTKGGKRVDKTESCGVDVNGRALTVFDSGGVGTNITWTVVATDPSGNRSAKHCQVSVEHPRERKADVPPADRSG